MIRTLWFVVRTAALVVAAVWIANRPGTVDVHWLGYDVRAKMGAALLALLVLFIVCLVVYRLISGIVNFPRTWQKYLTYQRRQKGFRSLTLGLTAVAAGDGGQANYHAYRVRRFLPEDKGLSVLLEAQSARLRGEDHAAQSAFRRLMQNEDTAFLGLRGLLLNALEQDDAAAAAALAAQALKLHPQQPWVLRTAYELELRQGHWEQAHRLLKNAARHGAVAETQAVADRAALLLLEAEDALRQDDTGQALHKLKEAYRLAPDFVPASLALARYYIDRGQSRAAAAVIEKTWREQPHPDLVPLWHAAMPEKGARDLAVAMAWYERLVNLRPDHVESHLAAAEAALSHNLWGAARSHLERADAIRSGPRLYRLRARLAQALDRPEESSVMLRRANEAPDEKVWVCRQTGRIYERWEPVAMPHGAFNSIIWDYPHVSHADVRVVDKSELLVMTPPTKQRQ